MDYVAVAVTPRTAPDGFARIYEVGSEASTLDALARYNELYPELSFFRRHVDADVFIRWSNGERLRFDSTGVSSPPVKRVKQLREMVGGQGQTVYGVVTVDANTGDWLHVERFESKPEALCWLEHA